MSKQILQASFSIIKMSTIKEYIIINGSHCTIYYVIMAFYNNMVKKIPARRPESFPCFLL